jgi:hypothetical protein
MQLRGKLLAAAVPTAIMMMGASQAPAMAATTFKTLYETPRHIKLQACQYQHKNSQGYTVWSVLWRADARKATVGGSVQFHNGGGRAAYTSGWVPFSKGKLSATKSTGFLPDETDAVVYLRAKTKYGTSKWSAGRYIDALPTC